MPRYRLSNPEVDVACYDGELVGMVDPVFGKVAKGTCPVWFPAVLEEVESLAGLAVVEGQFIAVKDEGMFFGELGQWLKVEPGSRIIRDHDGLHVVTAEDFLRNYVPA